MSDTSNPGSAAMSDFFAFVDVPAQPANPEAPAVQAAVPPAAESPPASPVQQPVQPPVTQPSVSGAPMEAPAAPPVQTTAGAVPPFQPDAPAHQPQTQTVTTPASIPAPAATPPPMDIPPVTAPPVSVIHDAGSGQLVMDGQEKVNVLTLPAAQQPEDQEALLKKAQAAKDQRMMAPFMAQCPVFKYENVTDEITADCTPEDLRKMYQADFPDLDEKKVSWTMNYGGITQPLQAGDSIYEAKKKLETSERLVDKIRKLKAGQSAVCEVTPTVRARSKGKALGRNLPEENPQDSQGPHNEGYWISPARVRPSYKAYCWSEEDVQAARKPIAIIGSGDGKLYQRRFTPIGEFTAPAGHLPELPAIAPAFRMKLPKIPLHFLLRIVSFFQDVNDAYGYEALVQILYDSRRQRYTMRFPQQTVSKTRVCYETEELPDHLVHVLDIHSHNDMAAFFSDEDNADEKATRLYAVAGRLNRFLPEILIRASCAGQFIPLDVEDVFDVQQTHLPYPEQWLKLIRTAPSKAGCVG